MHINVQKNGLIFRFVSCKVCVKLKKQVMLNFTQWKRNMTGYRKDDGAQQAQGPPTFVTGPPKLTAQTFNNKPN